MAAYAYHQKPALIGPSLLAADMSNLTSESIRVLDAGADYLHLDVMVSASHTLMPYWLHTTLNCDAMIGWPFRT